MRWNMSKGAESSASIRQVVAFNLQLARRQREMTQADLGRQLEECTGTKWSVATISNAEAGWRDAKRARHFDVNEVVAFAHVLRVPLMWFFLPPRAQPSGYPPSSQDDCWLTTRDSDYDYALSSRALASYCLAPPDDLPLDDLFLPRLRADFAEVIPKDSDPRLNRLVRKVRAAIDEYDRSDE